MSTRLSHLARVSLEAAARASASGTAIDALTMDAAAKSHATARALAERAITDARGALHMAEQAARRCPTERAKMAVGAARADLEAAFQMRTDAMRAEVERERADAAGLHPTPVAPAQRLPAQCTRCGGTWLRRAFGGVECVECRVIQPAVAS